jgi:hypothetical protein
MEIRQTRDPGRLRIMDRNVAIGSIEGSDIGFTGFTSPTDAGRAAWEAYRGIHRHRSGQSLTPTGDPDQVSLELGLVQHVVVAGRGRIARLVPPRGPDAAFDEWGFVMGLSAEDELEMLNHNPQVFLRSRARIMWRAIRRAGLDQLMRPGAANHTVEKKGDDHVVNSRGVIEHAGLVPVEQAAVAAASDRAGAGTTLAHRHGGAGMAKLTR